MTTTTVQQSATTNDIRRPETTRRLGRAISVVAAVIATGAIYLIAAAAGVDFRLTEPGASSTFHP
jgi:hypothetical protein